MAQQCMFFIFTMNSFGVSSVWTMDVPFGCMYEHFGYGNKAMVIRTSVFTLWISDGDTSPTCSSCQHCGKDKDPKFQPDLSRTYQPVKCTSNCNCDNDRNQCTYYRQYAEMSTSSGVLGYDVMSFANKSELAPQYAVFGCENMETGDIYSQHADGIMGLGRGDLSIMDQLAGKKVISDSFSLCYGGMDVGGGAMVLGGISLPSDMVFAHSDPDRREAAASKPKDFLWKSWNYLG